MLNNSQTSLGIEPKRARRAVSIVTLLLSAAFFLGLGIIDGPIWAMDSPSYDSMSFSREPVYPLFLMILRNIFGQDIYKNDLPIYLFAAVIVQSLLWIYVTFRVCMYSYDLAQKKSGKPVTAVVVAALTFLFQLSTPVINRFVVQRHAMYSELILTESIAMPLFVLFCVRLTKWRIYKKNTDFALLFINAFIMISTRQQSMIVLLLLGCVSFFGDLVFKKSRDIKRFLYVCGLAILVFASSKLFDATYQYVVNDYFHPHAHNGMGGMCTLIYASDQSDVALFTGKEKFPDEDKLFEEVYAACQEQGYLYDSVRGESWETIESHFADSYVEIGYRVTLPIFTSYLQERYPELSYERRTAMELELEKDFTKVLARQDKKDLFELFGMNLLRSLAYSIARPTPFVLSIFSFVVFFVYLLLLIMIFIKNRAGEAKDREILEFSLVTILGLLINVFVVSVFIYAQGRYMTYSTGLFFTAMVLMVIELRKRNDA